MTCWKCFGLIWKLVCALILLNQYCPIIVWENLFSWCYFLHHAYNFVATIFYNIDIYSAWHTCLLEVHIAQHQLVLSKHNILDSDTTLIVVILVVVVVILILVCLTIILGMYMIITLSIEFYTMAYTNCNIYQVII